MTGLALRCALARLQQELAGIGPARSAVDEHSPATEKRTDLLVAAEHPTHHLEHRVLGEEPHQAIERAVVVVTHVALERLSNRELVFPASCDHAHTTP